MKHDRTAYLLLLPALGFFLLFSVLPIILVSHLSLYKTNYITSQFVGLANYGRIFREGYGQKIINSFVYAALQITGVTTISLFLALFAANMSRKMQSYMRFVFYIPTIASSIILTQVWRWIYHPRAGLLNWILGLCGMEPVIWMGNRWVAIVAIAVVLISFTGGSAFIVYLAAILGIRQELFDSARIDGASWIQIKLRIILPMIAPIIATMTMFSLIGGFQIWETIYMMAPVASAYNTMFDMYETAFRFSHYGLGSAKALVLMAIILILAMTKRRLERL